MPVVFTNGCFDLFHVGHLSTLEFCREVAGPDGTVYVGVNSDASVRRLKGDGRPLMRDVHRAMIVRGIKYVDEVAIFDEDTPRRMIEAVSPDVIVKGGDYVTSDVVGSDLAEVRIAPRIDGVSTSAMIGKILLAYPDNRPLTHTTTKND